MRRAVHEKSCVQDREECKTGKTADGIYRAARPRMDNEPEGGAKVWTQVAKRDFSIAREFRCS